LKRQKSEKTFVEPYVQDKSQTVGVRAVKTENKDWSIVAHGN